MFCEKLKVLREEKSLTQDDLAKAIYVSSDLIAKYENGTTYPSKGNVEKIAIYFRKKVEELLENSETTSENKDSTNIAEKINFTGLIITAFTSFLMSIFVFIPVFHKSLFVVIGESFKSDDINFSIFSEGFRNGNFVWLILFLVSLVACTFSIISIVYKTKKYIPILNLISYLLFISEFFLFFISSAIGFSYIK